MDKKAESQQKDDYCPFIKAKDQKKAPYNRYQIHLSQPHQNLNYLKPNAQSQFNPFVNTYNQLGIKKPNILKSGKSVNFLKIHKEKETNESFFNRKKALVGSRFLSNLQDKDYYPISRKSVILYKHHYIKDEKKDKENLSKSKFKFLYENFEGIQSSLHQALSAYPNRPIDFVSQFGLNLRTPSQDHFLSILYNLNFDILYSSHYIFSNLITLPPPKDPEIKVMECLTKPFLTPQDPFQSERPKFSIEHYISDIENFADILDFNVALKTMKNKREQVQKYTEPITSRHSKKVLMSATPSDQNFFSVYEKDKLVSDSVLRADIFSYIGLRIRKNQRQEHLELEKTEIGWSQTRIPMRRTLLTNHGMFFEKRKQITLAHNRSGSNSSFSSLKSMSQMSQISQMSQMSQASQLSTISSHASQSSMAQAAPMAGSAASSLWNKEQSNPFTSTLFKDQIVSVISVTRIEKKSIADNTNAILSDDDDESDSESSFF